MTTEPTTRLLVRVSTDSFGEVWCAADEGGALTRIRQVPCEAPATEEDRDDLLALCVAGGSLRHPNVLPLLRAELVGEEVHLLSPWLPGGTLDALLEATGKDTGAEPDVASRIVLDVISGLLFFHAYADAHDFFAEGAVCSQSIYLGRDGRARLLEVPATTLAATTLPWARDAKRARFLPPEALDPESDVDPDVRQDVYAVGVLLFELLVGSAAFPDASYGETVKQGRRGLAPRRRLSAMGIPKPLVDFVERAVDIERSNRTADLTTFGEGLARVCPASGHQKVAAFLKERLGERISAQQEEIVRAAADQNIQIRERAAPRAEDQLTLSDSDLVSMRPSKPAASQGPHANVTVENIPTFRSPPSVSSDVSLPTPGGGHNDDATEPPADVPKETSEGDDDKGDEADDSSTEEPAEEAPEEPAEAAEIPAADEVSSEKSAEETPEEAETAAKDKSSSVEPAEEPAEGDETSAADESSSEESAEETPEEVVTAATDESSSVEPESSAADKFSPEECAEEDVPTPPAEPDPPDDEPTEALADPEPTDDDPDNVADIADAKDEVGQPSPVTGGHGRAKGKHQKEGSPATPAKARAKGKQRNGRTPAVQAKVRAKRKRRKAQTPTVQPTVTEESTPGASTHTAAIRVWLYVAASFIAGVLVGRAL